MRNFSYPPKERGNAESPSEGRRHRTCIPMHVLIRFNAACAYKELMIGFAPPFLIRDKTPQKVPRASPLNLRVSGSPQPINFLGLPQPINTYFKRLPKTVILRSAMDKAKKLAQAKRKDILDLMAAKFLRHFLDVLGELRGKDLSYVQYTEQDRYRLLILLAWSRRYRVPVDYVVKTLIHFWDKKIGHPRGRRKLATIIGVRIATLTGVVSQSVLEEQILIEFPTLENESEWKSRARIRMLPPDGPETEVADTIEEFMSSYRSRVERKRKLLLENKRPGSVYTRRPYRNNPWK